MPQREQRVNGNDKTDSNAVPETPFRKVIASAKTLTADDNGAHIAFDAAAGYTVTLPPAAPGLYFTVSVDTTVTSLVARLACATGDFFKGTILQGTDGTFTQAAQTANGTSHLAWEGNGGTTGGIIGDNMQVVKDTATTWRIRGLNTATGSTATPFKTS